MANTPSAKKRVRQIQRKTEVNKARKSRIKTFVRKVEEAIQSKDIKSASSDIISESKDNRTIFKNGIITILWF